VTDYAELHSGSQTLTFSTFLSLLYYFFQSLFIVYLFPIFYFYSAVKNEHQKLLW